MTGHSAAGSSGCKSAAPVHHTGVCPHTDGSAWVNIVVLCGGSRVLVNSQALVVPLGPVGSGRVAHAGAHAVAHTVTENGHGPPRTVRHP
eukprot:1931959-Prymnesium_polylepis.1